MDCEVDRNHPLRYASEHDQCEHSERSEMTTGKYTISAANRITGRSRTTIGKHLKSGKLSAEVRPDGSKLIDASELMRVYGDDCDFSVERAGDAEPKSTAAVNTLNTASDDRVVSTEQLATERAERDRERRQLEDQIEHLRDALAKAQDSQEASLRLLQNQSSPEPAIQQELNTLREELTRQNRTAQEQLQKQNEKLRTLQNQSFWKRLFGS